VGLAVVLVLSGVAVHAAGRVGVLLVDETKTLENSMRVQVLASLAKRTGAFDFSARVSDVATSFDHPLAGVKPTASYDVVLIVPRGLDDGRLAQIWILSRPIDRDMPATVRAGLRLLAALAEQVFPGVDAVNVDEDLIPAYLAALLAMEGWL